MEPLTKKEKALNIIFFLVSLIFFAYFIAVLFWSGRGTNTDVSFVYHDMKWIGFFVSMAGTIISYTGISRSRKGSFRRGLSGGFVLASAVLVIVVMILAP